MRCNDSFRPGEMMEVEPVPLDFSSCDRTGRRNAVPDIKGDGNVGSTSEFSKDTAQMDTQAAGGNTCTEEESSTVSHTPEGHGSGSVEASIGVDPS
ncbi:cAMP-dependent protein kinase inhibitor gamma-like [Anguilla rostrata]|uniref:cAMP-dependent protein kinase inhibitor gamma-like n=1 Tax=Anguilla rostrata TaxID=7938 RepID=UPI0030CD966C